MKDLSWIEKYRMKEWEMKLYKTTGDCHNGVFVVPVFGAKYIAIASNGGGWDHVSISPVKGNQCPTWNVMSAIKDMFFEDSEVAVEYHPAKSEYVNNLNNCLHLWRKIEGEFPMPPKIFV